MTFKKLDLGEVWHLTRRFSGEFMSAFITNLPALFFDHTRETEHFVNGIYSACTIYLAIFVTFIISGAQINPMTTLTVVLSRRMPMIFIPFYLTAQFLGTFCALLIGRTLSPFASNLTHPGMPMPGPGVSDGQAIVMEIIITFLLELAIVALLDELRLTSFNCLNRVNAFVLLIGVFFWIETIAAPISGACTNPARCLSASLLNLSFERQYIYLVGPPIGAILAVLVQEVFLSPDSSLIRLRALLNIKEHFNRNIFYSENKPNEQTQQTQNANVKTDYFRMPSSVSSITTKDSVEVDYNNITRKRILFPKLSDIVISRISSDSIQDPAGTA
ncbi:hypothetical protein ACTXT7_005445 [Hymenolepis weldensis]